MTVSEPAAPRRRRRSLRATFADSRRLLRIGYRDPEHLAERLTLYGAGQLGAPASEWASDVRAQRPNTPLPTIAEEVRTQTATVARVDGAISGTPFLIAFVPGYIGYLWQEGRLVLRTAALYGHDPQTLQTSAELLALRGVHPTVDAAHAALLEIHDAPLPEPPQTRRPLRLWVRSAYSMLIFGGFLSPPTDPAQRGRHPRLRTTIGVLFGTGLWVFTWIFPVTFMILMAWGCESHARDLGRRAASFYSGDAGSTDAAIAAARRAKDEGHRVRAAVRGALLFLSVAVPIGFVVLANHVVHDSEVAWLAALAALVALSLVIAVGVAAGRPLAERPDEAA